MSQAIQRGIILLTVLLVAAIGVAGFALWQKKLVDEKNLSLQESLNDVRVKQEKALVDIQNFQKEVVDLKSRVALKDNEKNKIQDEFEELKKKSNELASQASQATQERDDWKSRVETMRKERDQLMAKLKDAPVKIVYKEKIVTAPAASTSEDSAPVINPLDASKGDEYWAGILTQKAQLEVKLGKAKVDMDAAALQVGELRKQNAELQLQIKGLNNDKLDIERRLNNEKKMLTSNYEKRVQDLQSTVKDGEYLANNLSVEVAHARTDQKTANEYITKVKEDNTQLQSQVRQLVSTKVALEKTITRLSQEKDDMNKKLTETEGVIQDRISEIWQIKNTLDQKISQINDTKNSNKEVELPPIVVNASGSNSQPSAAMNQPHKIISINEKNNFIITDLGESQGSAIGRILRAYRDGAQIATLEVIQVRRDISAADIKDQKVKLQIGDQIR